MSRIALVVICATVLTPGAAPTAEMPEAAREIVHRVFTAAGGESEISRNRPYSVSVDISMQMKGVGDLIESWERHFVGESRMMRIEEGSTNDRSRPTAIIVINGDDGWIRTGAVTKQLPKEATMKWRDLQTHFGYRHLLQIRRKDWKVEVVRPAKRGNREVYGLRLTQTPSGATWQRDDEYLFDTKSNLLVESSSTISSELGLSRKSALIWDDYKGIDGLRIAHRVSEVIDGNTTTRVYRDFKFNDRLDPLLFQKP